MKKTAEEQIKVLFAKHSMPPLEMIIPILEKTGRGEQELTVEIYDTYAGLIKGIKEILGFKDSNMKTVANDRSIDQRHGRKELEGSIG